MRRHGLLCVKDDINKTTGVPRGETPVFPSFQGQSRRPSATSAPAPVTTTSLARTVIRTIAANGEAQLFQPQAAQAQGRDGAVAGVALPGGIVIDTDGAVCGPARDARRAAAERGLVDVLEQRGANPRWCAPAFANFAALTIEGEPPKASSFLYTPHSDRVQS